MGSRMLALCKTVCHVPISSGLVGLAGYNMAKRCVVIIWHIKRLLGLSKRGNHVQTLKTWHTLNHARVKPAKVYVKKNNKLLEY